MTIFELGALGEFIGAIAVVITLLYLAVQISQNTKATRAQIHQARSDQAQQYYLHLCEQSVIAEVFEKLQSEIGVLDPDNLETLSQEELRQLRALCAASISRLENSFYQYQNGFLNGEMYESMIIGQIRHSGRLWEKLGIIDGVPPSFREELRRRLSNNASG